MAGKKGKPSRAAAMKMKCHECMGGYADGRSDCEIVVCPLYTWMPYHKLEPNMDWLKINPSRKGVVEKAPSKRTMTDEQRKAVAERFRKARDNTK
jgi:hypothetical protein